MTQGSGDDAKKANQPAESPAAKGDKADRKVAKTLLEGATVQEQSKKPAKTMLEVTLDLGKEEVKAAPEETAALPASPGKKVAKTMLEVTLDLAKDEAAAAQGAIDHPEPPSGPNRKVAKTMLEVSTLELAKDAAEAAAMDQSEAVSDPNRKVAKTMLEVSRPDLNPEDAVTQTSLPSMAAQSGPKVAKTMLEVSRPDLHPSPASAPPTSAGPPKKVEKTLLELAPVTEPEPAPVKPVAKTLLDLPTVSEQTIPAQRMARTKLDVNSLDSIKISSSNKNSSKASQHLTLPVKISKSFTNQHVTMPTKISKSFAQPPNASIQNASDLDKTVKTEYKVERFVPRTMIDHSVLADTLSKSGEKQQARAAELAKQRASEPQKEFHPVDSKRLATPCAWTWSQTETKEKVRSCSKCQTQVYNFTGMELPEAEALIFTQENRKNAPLYKRADGKFMTRDCPVQLKRKRDLVLLLVVGSLVMFGAVALMLAMPPPPKPPAPTVVDKPETETPEQGSKTLVPIIDKDGSVHYRAGKSTSRQPVSNPVPPVTTPTTTTTPEAEETKLWETPPGGEIEIPQQPTPTQAPTPQQPISSPESTQGTESNSQPGVKNY